MPHLRDDYRCWNANYDKERAEAHIERQFRLTSGALYPCRGRALGLVALCTRRDDSGGKSTKMALAAIRSAWVMASPKNHTGIAGKILEPCVAPPAVVDPKTPDRNHAENILACFGCCPISIAFRYRRGSPQKTRRVVIFLLGLGQAWPRNRKRR